MNPVYIFLVISVVVVVGVSLWTSSRRVDAYDEQEYRDKPDPPTPPAAPGAIGY